MTHLLSTSCRVKSIFICSNAEEMTMKRLSKEITEGVREEDKGCVSKLWGAFFVDDLSIPVMCPPIEELNRKTSGLTLKVLRSSPFLTDSAVYLIGVSFCHYHRVIVSAQQMLQ